MTSDLPSFRRRFEDEANKLGVDFECTLDIGNHDPIVQVDGARCMFRFDTSVLDEAAMVQRETIQNALRYAFGNRRRNPPSAQIGLFDTSTPRPEQRGGTIQMFAKPSRADARRSVADHQTRRAMLSDAALYLPSELGSALATLQQIGSTHQSQEMQDAYLAGAAAALAAASTLAQNNRSPSNLALLAKATLQYSERGREHRGRDRIRVFSKTGQKLLAAIAPPDGQ